MGHILLVNQDSAGICGSNPTTLTGQAGANLAQQPNEFSIQIGDRFDLTDVLENIEKNLILRMLKATNGAQAEAARRMGLSRSALAYKLTKYRIRPADGPVTEDSYREHQSTASV